MKAELKDLLRDFDRLFSVDVDTVVRVTRTYWPSRFEEPRSVVTAPGPRGEERPGFRWCVGKGLSAAARCPKTADEAIAAPIFYDRGGKPIVDENGLSYVSSPGWDDSVFVLAWGPGASRFQDTLQVMDDLVSSYAQIILPMLYQEGRLSLGTRPWASIVNRIAELAERRSFRPPVWFVSNGKVSWALDAWVDRRFDEHISEADRLLIGENPEVMFADRHSFARDSETAIEWLIQQVEKQSVAPDVAATDQDIPREALRAVIDKNLAGVLRAAESVPSRDKVSEVMLSMIAADPTRYWWPANEWVRKLECSKPTIVGNKKKGEPPCKAWSEIMAWRESNKQSRFPKKPTKKT